MKTAENTLREDYTTLWNKLEMLDLCGEVIDAMKTHASQFRHSKNPNGEEKEIISKVANFLNISVEDIKEKSRKKEIREARQIAVYFVKNITKLPVEIIGEIFDRSHGTILHSCNVINDLCLTNKDFRNKIEEIGVMLNAKFKYEFVKVA